MKMWRVGLVAVMLTAVAFAGCKVERRTYVVREYPPPPPATVYVPAPARVPAPAYLPPPPAPAYALPPPMPQAQADIEVMTRGPVHEAFGELISYGPQAGLVVSRAPPQPVMEIPPDERPADPRIVWIPGYWTWDDDRNDFTWVSGCWRFPPPGCAWMPGYWTQVPAGFQWVAGFWLPSSAQQAQQVVYLPAPPATVEVGPPGLPPADTFVWIPGYYAWNGMQYVWQPGYWALAQRDWVWVPAHYVYAPRGCIFVAGYWDHTIVRRGILFAPVYFGHGVYLRAGFRYSPAYAIDSHVLVINLFARPQYSHYYFGDYYDVRYVSLGIHPWFQSRERRGWYDPIAVHEEWRRRHDDPMWERRERERFTNLRENVAARPAHTFAAQEAQVARLPKAQRSEAQMAMPLARVAENPPPQMKFEKINEQERQKIGRQATEVHKYGEARAKWEAPPAPAGAKPGTKRAGAKQPAQAIVQPTIVAPPTTGRRPEPADKPPTGVRTPADVRQPPTTVAPPTTGRRPEPTVTPPTVVAPSKEVAPPKVVAPPPKVVTPPTVAPPAEVRRPEPPAVRRPDEVRPPPATVAPVAPPTTVKRPDEVRPPEKVNIPKPPIASKPPDAREVQPPPRLEPPKAVGPVAPRAEQPAPPPRTIAPLAPRVEQPAPVRGKEDEKDKDEKRR